MRHMDDVVHVSVVSEEVRMLWALGGLKELTGISKKELRKAYNIVLQPQFKTVVVDKRGKPVRRMYIHGFYRYTKRQKGKKRRKIMEPHPDVQNVYRKIKVWLEGEFEPHKRAYGCVRRRNCKDAVMTLIPLFAVGYNTPLFPGGYHRGYDVANAFPSITDSMVSEVLVDLGIEPFLAKALSWLVTCWYKGKRRLPLGASCSPIILNLVYKKMCDDINKVCLENGIIWSVYVDDFNFAGSDISDEVMNELSLIPRRYGFALKAKKMKDNHGKTIPHLLGLTVVDGKLHISRRKKKAFRRRLYVDKMYDAYSEHVIRGTKSYIRHIYGEEENWPGWLKI